MKITLLTMGTRGDVQPYVALGKALKQAGYDVTLATNQNFEAFVTGHGLNFGPIRLDLMALMQRSDVREAVTGGKGKLALYRDLMPQLRRMLDEAWQAAQGSAAVVYHIKVLAGPHIAEALNVPGFASLPLPAIAPTGAFPNPIVASKLRLGGAVNRLTFQAVNRLSTLPFAGMINRWRQDVLRLPPRGLFAGDYVREGRPVPVLYPVSPHVVPRPADWPSSVHMEGYWFLDEATGWQPPAALAAFLAAGSAPVYVGFGSMASADAEAFSRMVLDGIERSGARAVIATGWGGLQAGDLPPTVFRLDSAPHDWLFPRVAAVVHHGGAGTTAAGLRAGKPSVIVPFFGDQPFWGGRVADLGVGPTPIPQKRLTADALAQAIRAALDDTGMRSRAETLGTQIRSEEGLSATVRLIQQTLG